MKKNKKVVIIDTQTSNIQSVMYACEKNNINFEVVSEYKSFKENEVLGLIVPGVGSFKQVMKNLISKNLDKLIIEILKLNKPSLFICVGMQILFTESEEFEKFKGLGIFKGKVLSIPKTFKENKLIVPVIGWNKIKIKKENQLFKNIKSLNFYFTHSFYVSPEENEIIHSYVDYKGFKYCSSICYKNILATQFHPEKSSKDGLNIYKNFYNMCYV